MSVKELSEAVASAITLGLVVSIGLYGIIWALVNIRLLVTS